MSMVVGCSFGWFSAGAGGGGASSWAATLLVGNVSGGTDPTISAGDDLIFPSTVLGSAVIASPAYGVAGARLFAFPASGGIFTTGSGTTDVIPKWVSSNSNLTNGSWEFDGATTIRPITDGSDIGDITHRVSTLFMSSTINYSTDLNWVNGVATNMFLTTSGNLNIGSTTDLGYAFNIERDVSTGNFLRFYGDRAGGALVADFIKTDFQFNDSLGARVSFGSNSARVEAATAGSERMGYILQNALKAVVTNGILNHQVSIGVFAANIPSSSAVLFVQGASSSLSKMCLVRAKDSLSTTFAFEVENSSFTSLFQVNANGNINVARDGGFTDRRFYVNNTTNFPTAFWVNHTFVTATATGSRVDVTGANTTNRGLLLTVSGATNNYGIIVVNANQNGFGVSSPTALVHLAAGTATASTAPLKFTTGTLLGTPESGVMEFLGSFFHLATGTIRHAISTFGRTVVSTATYTVLVTDRILGVTRTATGTATLTLPAAANFPAGYPVTIKDEGDNATTFNITINPAVAETIDTLTSYVINTDLDSVTIYSDGVSAWFVK